MINQYKIVGIFLSDIRDEFRSRYVQKISDAAEQGGYRVIIYNSFPADVTNEKPGSELYASVQMVDFSKLDIMVILTLSLKNEELLQALIQKCQEHSVKVILVDRYQEGCYGIENRLEDTFEKLVRHIFAKHHVKNAIMISGPEDNIFSKDREEIFLRVAEEYCLPILPDTVCHSDMGVGKTMQIVDEILRNRRRPPEAFVCANDVMANAVIDRLGEYGYQVPNDVLVTGVDGSLAESYHSPSLTTCQLMVDRDAMETIDLIHKLFNGQTTERRRLVPHELILGASCGCKKETASSYSRTAEQLYVKNCVSQDLEERCFQMISSVVRGQCLDSVGEKLLQNIRRASLVAVNEDYRDVKRKILLDIDAVSYSDRMFELAGKLRSGDMKCGAIFDRENIFPDLENQINAKEPILLTPLVFDDYVYGYYATHFNNVMDNTGQIFWACRMAVLSLNIGLLLDGGSR